MKFNKNHNLLLIIVDVSTSTGAFFRTVCPIAVRHSVSGWNSGRRTETRGLTNSPTSTTTCSPRNWAANGDQTDRSDEGSSWSRNVNNN